LNTPIDLWAGPQSLDELLDIMRHGRFVLGLGFDEDTPHHEIDEIIAKCRRASNLD